MIVGLLVLIAAVIVLVMWISSQQRRPGQGSPPVGMSAREALDHRLVSGEISGEQYDQLRARLERSTGPPPEPHPKPPAAPPAAAG